MNTDRKYTKMVISFNTNNKFNILSERIIYLDVFLINIFLINKARIKNESESKQAK